MKRAVSLMMLAGGVFAIEGCAAVSGGAKSTGRAALRAAGVQQAQPEPTETAKKQDNGHWSEDWVWEGDSR